MRGIILTAAVCLLLSAGAWSTVIDVPGNYPAIQQAIDVSVSGDTVLVAEGTYYERIDFSGKAILVASNYIYSGDTLQIQNTIIDADTSVIGPDDMGSVVSFVSGEDSTSILEGFTITKGIGSFLNIYTRQGGGVFCMAFSGPKIVHNIIRDNSAEVGGGVCLLANSHAIIRNNRISNNIGSGICAQDSDPKIEGNTINGNLSEQGGGIYCAFSVNPVIENNIIYGNDGAYYGGGIFCYQTSATIIRNILYDNTAGDWGGGICCDNATPTVINNIISDNTALGEGGGLYCFNNSNVGVVNTILWANTPPEIGWRSGGSYSIAHSDIRGGWAGHGNIDEDPLFISAYEGDYNICSQSPCIDAGDPSILDPDSSISDIGVYFPDHELCDIGRIVHVSIQGNDLTGDGTAQNPFRTINHSFDESYSTDTILVENGTYTENVDMTAKELLLASNYLFSQDTMDIYNTIIDGNADTSSVVFSNCYGSSAISGFTIRNGYGWFGGGIFSNYSDMSIDHNIITGNASQACGGGIYCNWGNVLIRNNSISDNISGGTGGGIDCFYCEAIIRQNFVSDNSAEMGGGIYTYNIDDASVINNNIVIDNFAYQGGGLQCFGTAPSMKNNLFSRNVSSTFGGAIYCHWASPVIVNSILWGDSASEDGPEIYMEGSSFPVVTYSDIEGSWQGEGNIDLNPLFCDPVEGDFHLMSVVCGDSADSPCIDAGHPDSVDIVLGCQFGLGGTRADMGAYGGDNGDWVTGIGGGHDTEVVPLPKWVSLLQNYPNPFNAVTTIEFNLLEASKVKLTVFDLLGREVRTLVDGYESAGPHSVIFDASSLSSGVYFYRLQAENKVVSKRMILLK